MERPILMSAPMIRGILDGRKSQTRRTIKPQPEFLQVYEHKGRLVHDSSHRSWCWNGVAHGRYPDEYLPSLRRMCRYGVPGDLLWVRETCMWFDAVNELPGGWGYRADLDNCGQVRVVEGDNECQRTPKGRWRPSIHMPRAASRITLRVTDVRVERLNDISEDDAKAEGLWSYALADDDVPFWHWSKDIKEEDGFSTPKRAYADLWDHINGDDAWAKNPWTWVIAFERVP